ncbi:unnamed protein product [Prunus armeniaca]
MALLSTFSFRHFLHRSPKLKPPLFAIASTSLSLLSISHLTPKRLKLHPRSPLYLPLCHCSSFTSSYPEKTQPQTLLLSKDERLASGSRQLETTTTIAAIVTSLGGPPGAVGIVRLSGPSAVAIVGRVFRQTKKRKKTVGTWRPTSHVVEYGVVCDSNGNVIDEVLAVPMLAPRSYTREDVVELQCHGTQVCLNRVLRACVEAGARLAEPGEFTLRAFLNGRLDLTQAENVDKLISAKSVAAADAALAAIQACVFVCLYNLYVPAF